MSPFSPLLSLSLRVNLPSHKFNQTILHPSLSCPSVHLHITLWKTSHSLKTLPTVRRDVTLNLFTRSLSPPREKKRGFDDEGLAPRYIATLIAAAREVDKRHSLSSALCVLRNYDVRPRQIRRPFLAAVFAVRTKSVVRHPGKSCLQNLTGKVQPGSLLNKIKSETRLIVRLVRDVPHVPKSYYTIEKKGKKKDEMQRLSRNRQRAARRRCSVGCKTSTWKLVTPCSPIMSRATKI